jgi:predicted dehydrogenase
MTARRLRFGMVGGGRGAFIGAVHRIAARMDGLAELVAGALSSDAERARASAEDLFVPRSYGSFEEMASKESKLSKDQRIDFVVIVTPNHQHFAPAKTFLEAGFHVILDKPVTFDLAQALELRTIVKASKKLFVLTHNYSGNVMVKQARELVRSGALGDVRKIVVEYSQGWLASKVEETGQKQAAWRTDPARSGASGCLGDIGTHAQHLAYYVTGLRIEELCAELTTFVPGRALEDDGNILLRFEGGAKGILHASQIAVGEENNLNLRVYGTKASLEWRQEFPFELTVKFADKPRESWRPGNAYVGEAAKKFTRIPSGHPEGYLEAFGNIYREAFRGIAAAESGQPIPKDLDCPTIDDGVRGMQFIASAIESAKSGSSWVKVPNI